MRSTSHPRNRAARPVLPYEKPYIRALLIFSHRPQPIHLASPTVIPSHPKVGKSSAESNIRCGAGQVRRRHGKTLTAKTPGSARKAQSDQEAKLCHCLHVNEVLAVASSSPETHDEHGPKKSHAARKVRSLDSTREIPTKYQSACQEKVTTNFFSFWIPII
jgi:hypothetical protein